MGFLDSSTAVIEATLTDRGKQLLIENPQKFKIVKFALGDDDIDYSLTESEISELLITEPLTTSNAIRSKLVTYPKGTLAIHTLQINFQDSDGNNQLDINGNSGRRTLVTMSTSKGYQSVDESGGYTVSFKDDGIQFPFTLLASSRETESRDGIVKDTIVPDVSIADKGKNIIQCTSEGFYIVPNNNLINTDATYTRVIDIIGNQTGATKSLTVNINYSRVDIQSGVLS